MRVRICNIGIEHLPKNLENLDQSLLARLEEKNYLDQSGIMTHYNVSPHKQLDSFLDSTEDPLNYSKNGTRMIFYLGQKITSETTTFTGLEKLLGFKKPIRLRSKIFSQPHVLALIGNENYRLTAICSISGIPNKEVFQQTANILKKITNSKIRPEFIVLSKTEMINFASDYLGEGHLVMEASANLTEGAIVIRHPDNIFQDPDVKHINDAIQLQQKIERGDWKFLRINLENQYVISLSKTTPDVFTLYVYRNEIDLLIESCFDILQRIFALKDGKIPRSQTLEEFLPKNEVV